MDARRKRLLFRAQHCGMKENDILLGGFAEAEIETLNDSQLDSFEALMAEPDNDVYNWITGRSVPPAERNDDVMKMLQNFSNQK